MAVTSGSPAPDGAARTRVDDVRDVALTLFAQRGYHGTSMRHIADALGVRVPTLYSHIRSKQELLAAIAVDTTDAVWSDYERVLDEGGADPRERLRRAVEVFALRHATHRREALIVNRDVSSLEEPTRSRVLAERRRHERAIRGLIADGVEAGVLHTGSPALASFAILEMSVSIAHWFREDGPLTAEEVARRYGEFGLRVAGAVTDC
jgi:AcrR family transcriptional regulator